MTETKTDRKTIGMFIVEDEAITTMLYKMSLPGRGYTIVGTSATGEQAVKDIPRLRPEVVLMDINLAGELDGISTAERIMAESMLKIVFVTGYSDQELYERAQALQPVAYLIKPVNIEELDHVIRTRS